MSGDIITLLVNFVNKLGIKGVFKMTVKEFVEKYNLLMDASSKQKLVEAIIVNEYVPVLKKRLVLENMLKKSIIEDKNGNRYIDMFVNQINFSCIVLALYTKFDLTRKDDSSVYDDYDLLVSSGSMEHIMKAMNGEEINRLISINKQVMDTFYNKEKTTEAYINKLITQCTTVFGSMCNSGLEQLSRTLQDENKELDIIDFVIDTVKKFKK